MDWTLKCELEKLLKFLSSEYFITATGKVTTIKTQPQKLNMGPFLSFISQVPQVIALIYHMLPVMTCCPNTGLKAIKSSSSQLNLTNVENIIYKLHRN